MTEWGLLVWTGSSRQTDSCISSATAGFAGKMCACKKFHSVPTSQSFFHIFLCSCSLSNRRFLPLQFHLKRFVFSLLAISAFLPCICVCVHMRVSGMFEVSQQCGAAQWDIERCRLSLYSSLFTLSISASKESECLCPSAPEEIMRCQAEWRLQRWTVTEDRLKSEAWAGPGDLFHLVLWGRQVKRNPWWHVAVRRQGWGCVCMLAIWHTRPHFFFFVSQAACRSHLWDPRCTVPVHQLEQLPSKVFACVCVCVAC